MADTALPVIDVTALRTDPDSPAAQAVIAELAQVVHSIGFFYVTGHGIDASLFEAIDRVNREFFALPEADRLEIENTKSPQFRGYTRFGHERTNGRTDLRDQIDISHERPAYTPSPDEPQWLRLRGPNQWPSALPGLRPVATAWMEAVEQVGHLLLRALSVGLGQPADFFDAAVDPPEVLLKMIRYRTPADAAPTTAEPGGGSAYHSTGFGEFTEMNGRQGVGAHRDSGFLSFIHQDSVGGLQVERGGHLVDVPALPGTLVVNIGEMLQLISQGYYKATVHRVVSPPPGVDRFSVAYFFNPNLEATLVPVELPARLAAEAPGGASADPNNPILANYGDNSLKVRLRAHPDVAERFHADLLASGRWSS